MATFYGTSANNTLTGGTDADRLFGYDGNDTLSGGLGNDVLNGGSGSDSMVGGDGDDTYIIDNVGDVVVETTGQGRDLANIYVTNYTLSGTSVENIRMYNGSISIVANDENNSIRGNDANNLISAGKGNDNVYAGSGNDTVYGGDDRDLIYGEAGDDYLFGELGNDKMSGGDGNDTLIGSDGNDNISGDGGNDSMVGGIGNDSYFVDSLSDIIVEVASQGYDTVYSDVSFNAGAIDIERVYYMNATTGGVITGNSANNQLIGNSANDTLDGGAGNDVLNGGEGNDSMAGGAGNDTFYVDSVGDVVKENAGEGLDTIITSISYTLSDLAGFVVENLKMSGEANINGTGNSLNNVMSGNDGNNKLYGMIGNDILDGGAGADTMEGGAGNDQYYVDSTGDVVVENPGEGNDRIYSYVSYTIPVNVENFVMLGQSGLTVMGNASNNYILGNVGNNTINGGAGKDTMLGGAGDDYYVVDNTGDIVTENASEGFDTVYANTSYTLPTNVERLIVSSSVLQLTGNTLDNALTGNSLNNTITALDGNDTLDGGTGADAMYGGIGNDVYYVDNSGDVVSDTSGTDTVYSSISYTLPTPAEIENLVLIGTGNISGTGNSLANQITGNGGKNTLDGGTGTDTMAGGDNDDVYYVDVSTDVVTEAAGEGVDTVYSSIAAYNYTLGNNVENLVFNIATVVSGTGNALDNIITGNTGNDNISGLDGNDILDGGSGNDTLSGGNGADILKGGSGTNSLIGGDGDDQYYVDNATDVIVEGSGGTTGSDILYSSVTFTVPANVEQMVLTGTGAINGTGTNNAETITGNTGNNNLSGLDGNDVLSGGDGADTLSGGNGNDNLLGGNGNDSIVGGAGDDILNGGDGDDNMSGGDGNDSYYLESPADVVSETGTVSSTSDTVYSNFNTGLGGNRDVDGDGNDDLDKTGLTNVENITLLEGGSALYAVGSSLSNIMIGNAQNNIIEGWENADTLYGLDGNDILYGEARGNNTSAGNDTLYGGNGNDTLYGGDANDVLYGNAGDDVITGDNGTDTMYGGTGNDVIYLSASTDVAVELSGEGTDWIVFNYAPGTVNISSYANFENLYFTTTAVTATGNTLANYLRSAGDSSLVGGLGNDVLDGRQGSYNANAALTYDDTLNGGDGNDTYYVSVFDDYNESVTLGFGSRTVGSAPDVNDYIIEGTGNDTVYIEWYDNDDTGSYSFGFYTNDGGDGLESATIDLSTKWGGLIENVTFTNTNGMDYAKNVTGNSSANILVGGASSNTLLGMGGNDILNGGGGADNLQGGDGDDYYYIEALTEISVNDTSGNDTVVSPVSVDLTTFVRNIENVTLTGSSALNATGDANANILYGNDGANTLTGNGGIDTMRGGLGDDIYVTDGADVIAENIGQGTDTVQSSGSYTLPDNIENLTLTGSANINGVGNASANNIVGNSGINYLDGMDGNDTIDGGGNNDTIIGGNGSDNLNGAAGADTLNGGDGSDTLDGGAGADSLIGGGGDDLYKIDDLNDRVVDILGDGTDTAQISVTGFSFGAAWAADVYVENFTITGSFGNFTGNSLDNTISLENSGAVNTGINGGAGVDTYTVDATTDGITDTDTASEKNVIITKVSGYDMANAAGIATLTLSVSGGSTSALGNTLDNIFNARNTVADTNINGKAGNDKYYLDSNDTVSASVAEGAGDTIYSVGNYDMSANAVNVSNLTVESTSTSNKGNAQANTIDTRNGLTNSDIQGLGGDDIYVIDATGDTVTEAASAGTDTIKIMGSYTLGANIENLVLEGSVGYTGQGNTLANTLTGNTGDNTLVGGGGTDTFNGGLGNDVFYVDSADDVVSELSGEGNDTVFTSVSYTLADLDVENITLSGGVAALVATGNSSNNVLDGSLSTFADTLRGGLGDDIYYVGTGDVVDEAGGGGIDTLIINYDASYTLAAGAAIENIILGEVAVNRSASGNELANFLQGNATNNTLIGGAGDDTLDGMGGVDSLVGGLGDDAFFIDNGSDTVSESANEGQDTVYSQASSFTLPANVENLYLVGLGAINGTGNSDNNLLVGNAGANSIVGGGGNDVYNGMQGNDTIDGGIGDSTYLYARGDNADTITDSGGSDAINFGADISLTQLWFNASGNDLVIWLVGTATNVSTNANAVASTSEKITIKDWYVASANQVELFTTSDGYSLTSTNVDLLVTAMSSLTPPGFGYTDVPPEYYDSLESVYYAAWQAG